MLADAPQVLDAFRRRGRNGVAFEVIVDVLVGHAECFLVGQRRAVLFQVGGGDFLPETRVGAELAEESCALAFVEAGEGGEVGGAIAELGEETGDVFRRVVSADDQEVALASKRVLRHHPKSGLHVALVEVAE